MQFQLWRDHSTIGWRNVAPGGNQRALRGIEDPDHVSLYDNK